MHVVKVLKTGKQWKEDKEEGIAVSEAVNRPSEQLGQSLWSSGGLDLVSDECRPPGRKHGPQSGPYFLCEKGKKEPQLDTTCILY